MGDNVFKMNLNKNYIDVQMMRLMTPNREQKAYIYSLRRSRNNTSSSEVHFPRIYQCCVISSNNVEDHVKLIYLMESRNSNCVLFDKNVEYCDDGTVTIGCFMRILAPQPIENNMNGDIPLVRTPHPVILISFLTTMYV